MVQEVAAPQTYCKVNKTVVIPSMVSLDVISEPLNFNWCDNIGNKNKQNENNYDNKYVTNYVMLLHVNLATAYQLVEQITAILRQSPRDIGNGPWQHKDVNISGLFE